MTHYRTKYGYFDPADGSYVVTDPRTPLPWANIICPGKLGVGITASGDGFTWYEHARYNMLTRWIQDFTTQTWGKFIYIADDDDVWSASFNPCQSPYTRYHAVHAIGSTEITQVARRFGTRWKITVDPETNIEFWRLTIKNLSGQRKRLHVLPYIEWALGKGVEHHRPIHECFLQTELQGRRVVVTRSMWDIPSKEGHWNQSYPYTAFFSSSVRPTGWQYSKRRFLGRLGQPSKPKMVFERPQGSVAGSNDLITAVQLPVVLDPQATTTIVFMMGVTDRPEDLGDLEAKYLSEEGFDEVEERVRGFWDSRFEAFVSQTPEKSLDLMLNRWLSYQVYSSRIFGRAGYYIQGGGYGYREIQDLLAVIPVEPGLARERLLLYAQNQYADLTIPHHFDPLTGERGAAAWSDDMLWLPFITTHYLKETADFALLDEAVPYIDGDKTDTYYQHCVKGIDKVWNERGESGLPLIKEGDWNDGLSAVGLAGKGESVWLAQFLAGILTEFVSIATQVGDASRAKEYESRFAELKKILNTVAWDGAWYRRARCDSGRWIGSSEEREGQIFLNPQIWAILNDLVDDDEQLEKLIDSLDEHLYTEEGPVLFWPPYTEPDPEIGYLTRYNAGVRENGGVYTHAANWALAAEAKLNRREHVWAIYQRLCPALRSQEDPDRFMAEPYVTSGSIECKPSPFVGKGGWTWYTSSGAWFYKVLTESLLGIAPRYDGLDVQPCVPREWRGFRVQRDFRGHRLTIYVQQVPGDKKEVLLDGEPIEEDFIPARLLTEVEHEVLVRVPVEGD